MARLTGISPRFNSFLDTIGWSEGTLQIPGSDDGYNVLVGSTLQHPILFQSYADHPRIYNAQFNSTAAGRYQIIKRNYDIYKPRLGLPDFGPESQDRIAIQMIKECGATPDVEDGNLYKAMVGISSRWASLPFSNAGQNKHSMDEITKAYAAALDVYV